MKLKSMLKVVLLCAVVLLAASCESKITQGAPVPSDKEITSLDDVLSNAASFNTKKVVMKGVVGPKCCPSLCDMKFKSGKNSIKLYPKGFKLEDVEAGTPVTAYVEVISGDGQNVFSVLGLEF